MAKLKLKSVQNGTESGNPNLMASDSYVYVDCSGYVIVGSGVYDNSGNVVEEGCIVIDAGHDELRVGTEPCFQIDVTWNSGVLELPLAWETEADGAQPSVNVTFDDPILIAGKRVRSLISGYYHDYDILVGTSEIETQWRTPFLVRINFDYTLSDGQETIDGQEYGYLFIPYRYERPKNNGDEGE